MPQTSQDKSIASLNAKGKGAKSRRTPVFVNQQQHTEASHAKFQRKASNRRRTGERLTGKMENRRKQRHEADGGTKTPARDNEQQNNPRTLSKRKQRKSQQQKVENEKGKGEPYL